MKTLKMLGLTFVAVALLLVVTTKSAQADRYYYYNPLLLPFAVAGSVIGTAAAITTGIVPVPFYAYPAYYGPRYYAPAPAYYGPRSYYYRPAWIPRHHVRYGARIPGHWSRY
jgi:hypothetical protein